MNTEHVAQMNTLKINLQEIAELMEGATDIAAESFGGMLINQFTHPIYGAVTTIQGSGEGAIMTYEQSPIQKKLKVTALSMDEYMDVGLDPNEIETLHHAGLVASRFQNHHTYRNDLVLIPESEKGRFIIHSYG